MQTDSNNSASSKFGKIDEWALTLFALLVITGCVNRQYWVHPAKSMEDFYRDNSQCMAIAGYGQVAQETVGNNQLFKRRNSIYSQCMMGNGWSLRTASELQQMHEQGTMPTLKAKQDEYFKASTIQRIRSQAPCLATRGFSVHAADTNLFITWINEQTESDIYLLEQGCVRGDTYVIDNLL